ncbi:MAG: ferredoxin [Firmicutes bacterium]|nr:ferredoxin [Bacillota bacterium]
MGKKINLTIDGKKIQAMEGDKILWAALENDIYIPHLCAMKEQQQSPFAGCRLCFIEIEGKPRPVAACTEPALEGMVVNTRSESIDRLVEAGFNLIMSNHHIDCKNCAASGACELQKIAKERKIRLKPKKLVQLDMNLPKDHSKDCIIYDPNKCVLCGRCVTACRTEGTAVLGLAYRGFERMVTTFGDIPLGETECSGCGSCANVCPAGALIQTNK